MSSATPSSSATSPGVAPARAAALAWYAMQPSQRLTTEMASAAASLSRAGHLALGHGGVVQAGKPAHVSGIACRNDRVGSRSSRSVSS